ncbi:MAG: DUF455 family protein [Planctomycetota bacterium]
MTPNGQDWAREYVLSEDLATKLAPGPRGPLAEHHREPERLGRPGRALNLVVTERAERIPRAGALSQASAVARLLHVFVHHEIQAAELCAWALLAFPETPREFREGLLGILDDEVRHAAAYARRVEELGSRYGELPVRDWFWQRTLGCETPLQYVALMGLGFEGGNLEHARRFERQLREAGDGRSADLVRQVGREEVAHVRFAARWFCRWTGRDLEDGPDFDAWRDALPPPLTPAVLRGRPLDRERRSRAGLGREYLDRLDEWTDTTSRHPEPR